MAITGLDRYSSGLHKAQADAGMLFPWSGVPVSPVATGPGA